MTKSRREQNEEVAVITIRTTWRRRFAALYGFPSGESHTKWDGLQVQLCPAPLDQKLHNLFAGLTIVVPWPLKSAFTRLSPTGCHTIILLSNPCSWYFSASRINGSAFEAFVSRTMVEINSSRSLTHCLNRHRHHGSKKYISASFHSRIHGCTVIHILPSHHLKKQDFRQW